MIGELDGAEPSRVAQVPAERIVDRPGLQLHGPGQVQLQAVGEEGGAGLWREREQLLDLDDVVGDLVLPAVPDPVAEPAVDLAGLRLVDHVLTRAVALVPPLGVAAEHLPPPVDPGELARLGAADPVVERTHDRGALIDVQQPQPAGGASWAQDRGSVGLDLHLGSHGGHAVAETAIDGRFGRHQHRDDLAPLLDVLEVPGHDRPQDAPSPIGRQHGDRRQAADRDRGQAGQGQLHGVRPARPHDPVAVERGDAAVVVEAGAEVVRPLEDTDYGSRGYTARDPEGNLWSFGTYQPAAPTP